MKCENCKFWKWHGGSTDGVKEAGECRRYPPTGGPIPTTASGYWCGEHVTKEASHE